MKKRILNLEDTIQLRCLIDANCLDAKIQTCSDLIENNIEYIQLDDVYVAKKLQKLQKLIEQANKLSSEITNIYYDSEYKHSQF